MSAPAPKKLTKKLYKIIKEGCQTFFPNSRSRKWIFLLSLPGGKPQPAHRDFLTVSNKIDLYDFSSLPASVIIGLQDDSFIYGYGWNRQVALESEKEKIEFGEVDVLIFHGDFIHGGGDYTTRNVRVHVFLVPANTLQKKIRKSNSITLRDGLGQPAELNDREHSVNRDNDHFIGHDYGFLAVHFNRLDGCHDGNVGSLWHRHHHVSADDRNLAPLTTSPVVPSMPMKLPSRTSAPLVVRTRFGLVVTRTCSARSSRARMSHLAG
ncbi:hypothetical protein PF005_g13863 [Phytophthora fragariae]|uniref:Uncharacterized protein n=1 Tax=Phytophthora fragariae TaxID=53985 RepID=A0A6A3XRP6_9STRA|nr:hypothetical protein PF005_g13863 [Phytophthora fragariae]